MKGKLIKRSNGRFDLYAIEDINQVNTIASSFDNPNGKLSVKNCEAIELGYDLDELAKKYWVDEYYNSHGSVLEMNDFKEGFKKALEILGDKKFTDVNMEDAYYFGSKKCREEYLDFVKTFQQTEWNVEIEMEYYDPLPPTRQTALRPKLDSDGCLMLKRV